MCIHGANFDGNTFAEEALRQGAHHVIVDNQDYFVDNGRMTLVDDSIQYMQMLANHHRNTFSIPVIGITGSNGKTTTKELIYAVLKKKYKVLATEGNLNNHIGVPLTLLQLNDSHEIAIIEMGANRLKDIEELCEIAEPNYGIITNVGKAHLEGFGSFEGVITTKKELFDAISLKNGTIVVNADDPILNTMLPEQVKVIRFGSEGHFVNGKLKALTPFVQMQWSNESYQSPTLTGEMIGGYNFTNYLAAITFGSLFDVPTEKISQAVEEYTPTNNRSQVYKSSQNTLILDCYNANPTSMKSALDSFEMMNADQKLFVIGDMRELGTESSIEHEQIMKLIEKHDLNGFTVGEEFGKVKSTKMLKHFESVDQALYYFEKHPLKDTLVLLKGSRGIELEKLVPAL